MMKQKLQKTREYLDYIEEHYDNVQKAWELVREHCSDMYFVTNVAMRITLGKEIMNHDLSKLSHEEFIPYRESFYPVSDTEKQSSNFEAAWEHHKRANSHHYQHWAKIKNESYQRIHLIHNFVDWYAMSMKFNQPILGYYEANKEEIKLPAWAVKVIYEIAERLPNE